jgi:hypothetical protein
MTIQFLLGKLNFINKTVLLTIIFRQFIKNRFFKQDIYFPGHQKSHNAK